jgi:ring-1,2-phenylacetyl-CoA epoxidase subunit PaaC
MTANPNAELERALAAQLLALADDELILGHRDSEWTGHAPILEEDIAFANIAQDEIGHASLWYLLRKELTGDNPDRLVFFRNAGAYRSVQLVELPKGDWAFTMMRQYLFDAAELARLAQLINSRYRPIAETAAKIRTEEIYHYRHTSTWIKRLGLGTEESHRRAQLALDESWPYALQLFVPLPDEAILVSGGIVPNSDELRGAWEQTVVPFLKAASLSIAETRVPAATSREQHTDHLTPLLEEMQEVARLDPQAQW